MLLFLGQLNVIFDDSVELVAVFRNFGLTQSNSLDFNDAGSCLAGGTAFAAGLRGLPGLILVKATDYVAYQFI